MPRLASARAEAVIQGARGARRGSGGSAQRPRPPDSRSAMELESLVGLAEVGLQRGPATWQNGQVIRTIEPEEVLDPAQGEQRPDPEPLAARARLAAVTPAASASAPSSRPSASRAMARLARISSARSGACWSKIVRSASDCAARPNRSASKARLNRAGTSRGSSASNASYSAQARSTAPASISSLARLSLRGGGEGVARPGGDDRLVGRPSPRVIAQDLFHEAEHEAGLQQVGPLGRRQGPIQVVQRQVPVAPRVIEERAVASSPGRVGPQRDGRLIMLHGPPVLADAPAVVAQVEVRPVVSRLEAGRPLQPSDHRLRACPPGRTGAPTGSNRGPTSRPRCG